MEDKVVLLKKYENSNYVFVHAVNHKHLLPLRYLDILTFVPKNFSIPEKLVTKHLLIRPLVLSDAQSDYLAVMNNIDFIRGTFGPDDDWPQKSLTMEDDIQAIKNHELEFQRQTAFTFTIMAD